MSGYPLFTTKHYRYLENEIRRDNASSESKAHAVEILCRVFAKENPNFRPDIFIKWATAQETES